MSSILPHNKIKSAKNYRKIKVGRQKSDQQEDVLYENYPYMPQNKNSTTSDTDDNYDTVYVSPNSSTFSNGYAAANRYKETIYVGSNNYEIVKFEKPMELVQLYIQSIMNDVYGLLYVNNLQDTCDPSIYRTFCGEILCYMFQSILRYNAVILPYKTTLYSDAENFCINEPMSYKIDESYTKLNIYINTTIVDNIFQNTNIATTVFTDEIIDSPNILNSIDLTSISMTSEGSTTSTKLKVSNDKCVHVFKNVDYVYKLFAIADHAATHFYQEYKTGSTDWINHSNFGHQNATTINSIFNINAEFTNTCIKTQFNANYGIADNNNGVFIDSNVNNLINTSSMNNSNLVPQFALPPSNIPSLPALAQINDTIVDSYLNI